MERYPLKALALALILSFGAFLFYVRFASLALIALLLIGMALTFVLGLYAGFAEAAPERKVRRPAHERGLCERTLVVLPSPVSNLATGRADRVPLANR